MTWKQINGYPNYFISSDGKIKNIKVMELKPTANNKGYLTIKLYNKLGRKTHNVHRLVAEHFITKIDVEKDVVNHKDENKLNNNVDNLEWVTMGENTRLSRLNKKK
jgi:hypothetical protein